MLWIMLPAIIALTAETGVAIHEVSKHEKKIQTQQELKLVRAKIELEHVRHLK